MSTETLQEMENVLKLQKKLHIEEGPASIELRKDRLNRCISMLKEFSDQELFTKFGTRFLKIKHTYNFDDSQIENWFDTSIQEEEIKMLRFKNDYNKELKKLEKLILERKVYEIEQKGTLEQVLEVFERINTKNTKLGHLI